MIYLLVFSLGLVCST